MCEKKKIKLNEKSGEKGRETCCDLCCNIKKERYKILLYLMILSFKPVGLDLCWQLVLWLSCTGRKKRICEKIHNFAYLLDLEERKKLDSVFITFIRIWHLGKKFRLYSLDPEGKKPDSVFITFIRICERKKFRLYLLDPEERNRIQFLLLL